jgi:aspartyl-tRNA(Asn)/glutamyl-tRNA(Gln) amidotransferase subunit A
MCRSVRDAARYVDVVAGPTTIDPTSLPPPVRRYEDHVLAVDPIESLRGKRVAWTSTLGFAACDPEVEKVARDAAYALVEDTGMVFVDVDATIPKPSRAWGILSALDVSSHYGEAAIGRLTDVTPVSRNAFEAINRLTPEQLLTALRRRDEMLAAIAAIFDEVDVLMTPTVATLPFAAEGPPPLEIAGQRVGGMGSVPYTAPFNMSGQPAASIPAGLSMDGLPIGLQVVARRHDEESVLACGLVAESHRPWPKFAPMAYT